MLIIGAKGFAKEILEVCHLNNELDNLCFYDDINIDIVGQLYGKFPILKSLEEAGKYFNNIDKRFTIGIGNPLLRIELFEKFAKIGGELSSTIAPSCIIGHYGNVIGEGCNIMQKVVLTNDVKIGTGVIINQLTSVGHDVKLGEFVEICPGAIISGNCNVGDYSFVGSNATLLPKIRIGSNSVVAAGAMVTRDVPDNTLVAGIPAIFKKSLKNINY